MADQLQLLQRSHSSQALSWFPQWALDEEASHITEALCNKLESEDKPIWWAFPCVTGPGTIYAFKANAFAWFFFLVYPIIGLAGTSCSNGFAQYNSWVWLPFLPMAAISLYFEFRCATYVMPTHLMVTKFKVLGVERSFNVWLALTASLSLVSSTEYVTVALFMVKTFKTSHCDKGVTNSIWHQVLEESTISFLSQVTLPTFALVLWLLMLAQPVYALAASIPISANTNPQANHALVDYKLKSDIDNRVVYNTLLGKGRHHNEVLTPLAEATRMVMPTYMNHSFLAFVWPHTSSQRICDDMQERVIKFFAFTFLHSALQPNMQTSSLAVTKAAHEQELDGQTVFSSCISLLAAFKALYTEYQFVQLAWKTLMQRNSAIAENNSAKLRASKLFFIFCFMVALYVFFISYAAVKLYMARWGCPQGVWNISGCVTVYLSRA